MESSRVVDHAYRSVKWAVLAQLLPRFITPASMMIVAGLLTPSDFGIVAASALVVSLAQVVVGLGMGAATVQRQSEVEKAASTAFALNLAMAPLLYAALWWLAPRFAELDRIPALTAVLRVAGLSLFLSALSSVPSALLQKRFEFRALFWIGAAPQIVTSLASLALALATRSYWALVIGPLCGLALNVCMAWGVSRWRPRFVYDAGLARAMLVFGLWILLSNLLSWLFLYGDNAIAAYFLGATGLGVYSLGFNVAALLPGLVLSPIASVAYPTFCALQGDGPRAVGLSMLKLQRVVAAALFPVCFGLSAIAVPAVSLVYGTRWEHLGETMRWLAIFPGLIYLWTLNADAYRAVGKPHVWTQVASLNLLVLLPLLALAAPLGLRTFVAARFVGASLYPLVNIVVGGRVLQLSAAEQIGPVVGPLLPALLMYALVTALVAGFSPFEGITGWLKLSALVAAGAGSYIGILSWREPELWRSVRASTLRIAARA